MDHLKIKKIAKYTLGGILITAGIGHLTFARKEFQAQVPDWTPLTKDDTVVYSGFAEIALGASLIFSGRKTEGKMGKIAAGFLRLYFPETFPNTSIAGTHLGSIPTTKRLARLFMQPLLVVWAIKSTNNNNYLNNHFLISLV